MTDIIKTEEKPKIIPKGEVVGIGAIVPGTPVHFTEQEIKPATKWDNPVKLPRLAVVTDVFPYPDTKRFAVTYRTGKGKVGNCYFPDDYTLRKLTGTIGKALISKYDQAQMANLTGALNWMGGSIGSDPEIFVEGKNGILPAFEFLGSKKKPTRTEGTGYAGNCGVYWDGFQAEFETQAAGCLAWQVDSVQAGLRAVLRAAKAHDKTAKLSTKTVFEVPISLLESSKDEHVEFGCMPSLNAYGLDGMKIPARRLTSRSAGGHIHFGIGVKPPDQMRKIVKALDATLGIACVSLFAEFDNPVRRQFYGLPGEYREPKHGLEYRTLSNAWLFHPLIMNIVFDLSRKAVIFGDRNLLHHFKGDEAETIDVIKNCDVPRARAIMDRNEVLFKSMIKSCYYYGSDSIYKIFRNGMEVAIKDPNDIAGNWNLEKAWIPHSDGKGKNVLHSYAELDKGHKV